MRRGGESYYVLVNNKDEVYTQDDTIEGEMEVSYNSWEEAEKDLKYLIDEGELNEADGWHVERHRW